MNITYQPNRLSLADRVTQLEERLALLESRPWTPPARTRQIDFTSQLLRLEIDRLAKNHR